MTPSKIAVWLVMVGAFFFFGCSQPQVDSHGDGATRLQIKIQVLDARSAAPIKGASVTFYSDQDMEELRMIAQAKEMGSKLDPVVPRGLEARTANDGYAEIACSFPAAFLYSQESRERQNVGTDIFPGGKFVVSNPAYRPFERLVREIYPLPPYAPSDFKRPIVVRLEPRQ